MSTNTISLSEVFPLANQSILTSIQNLANLQNSFSEDYGKEKINLESAFEKLKSILKSISPFPEFENEFRIDIRQSSFFDNGSLSKSCYEFRLYILDSTKNIMWSSNGLQLSFDIHIVNGALSCHKLSVGYGSGGYGDATNGDESIISKFMLNSFTIQHTFIERLKAEVFSDAKETSELKQLMLDAIGSCKRLFDKRQEFEDIYSDSVGTIEKTLFSQLTPVSAEQITRFINRKDCELTCIIPSTKRNGGKLVFEMSKHSFVVNKTGKASYKKDANTRKEEVISKEKIESKLSSNCYIIDSNISKLFEGLNSISVEMQLA